MPPTPRDARYWTNNCIGMLMVSVLLFVVTFAVNQQNPKPQASLALWFFGLLGAVSLGGWFWLSYQAMDKSRLGSLGDKR